MHCIIQERDNVKPHRLGESKEILVDSFKWSSNGETGKTYTYKMSNDKFERPINKEYHISLCEVSCESGNRESLNNTHKEKTYPLCTMHYYDFVDYDLEDCIGERKIESIAKQINIKSEVIWQIVLAELKPLHDRILIEYQQTKEYLARKYHEDVLKKYKQAKEDFQREYGIAAFEYDRCYNVFGDLMNSEYLNLLNQKLEERISMKKNSKNYRKYAYRENFNNYFNQEGFSSEYNESEREILIRFYKVLAKKYHPDSNPDIDTSAEMVLINKLKKAWRV